MTYLDLYGYNHVVKYDKSFNLLIDKKLNKASDNHGQLDMQIDNKGRLHLIGGGHTDDNNYYYVEKIADSFDFNVSSISTLMTYPKLYCTGDDLWIYYRDSLERHTNRDRWALVKTTINTLDIDFSNKEIITATGSTTMIPGYGQSTLFNGNELAFSCNWYDPVLNKAQKGFFIKKNLTSGKWFDVNNEEISIPIQYSYSNLIGSDFRQSQIAYSDNSYYFMKSEMAEAKVTLCKVQNSLIEKTISLPQDMYVNQLIAKDGYLYCLATNKTDNNVILYKSNDDFSTYEEVLVGNCGTTLYWTSSTLNIENNKIKVRLLVNHSNLEILLFDL